jgi:hypothetical protein
MFNIARISCPRREAGRGLSYAARISRHWDIEQNSAERADPGRRKRIGEQPTPTLQNMQAPGEDVREPNRKQCFRSIARPRSSNP